MNPFLPRSRAAVWLFVLIVSWTAGPELVQGAAGPGAPEPAEAIPTPRQRAWQQLEYYGFLHFTVNTFTDQEWGYGDESPDVFNPTAFDARQWAQVARDAGMEGLILTAKHHDGFCLWPSRFTEHSVKSSRWLDGKGDVVRAVADACAEFGLRFGVYLSPWDRNHPQYGRPEYLVYYRNQLRELLTQYGTLFEVWFDGANGGDGYYGGARETRRIDNATYYHWPDTWALVRELQPDAVMFSDAGPDVRWVGNERGVAFETSWLTIDRSAIYPGYAGYQRLAAGDPNAPDWVPPEVDVSIRPGWFYHPSEDGRVKSVEQLLDIYYTSVGRGANLLLNVPPDRRGLIHEVDAERLRQLRSVLDRVFAEDLARSATVRATQIRGDAEQFAPARVNDGDPDTYWATDDAVTEAALVLEWQAPVTFDHIVLQENIALGQRVWGWSLEAWADGDWQSLTGGETIGYKRIIQVADTTADRLRLRIQRAKACPTIATVAVFRSR